MASNSPDFSLSYEIYNQFAEILLVKILYRPHSSKLLPSKLYGSYVTLMLLHGRNIQKGCIYINDNCDQICEKEFYTWIQFFDIKDM